MSDTSCPASYENQVLNPKTVKRPAEDSDLVSKSKRGKYTSIACNECKKKKLKCIPSTDGSRCQRCVMNRTECLFTSVSLQSNKKKDDSHQIHFIGDQVARLQDQVNHLSKIVQEIRPVRCTSTCRTDHIQDRSPSTGPRSNIPKNPHFVGPTRPSYGLMIAERSLTQMGIPSSPSPSRGSPGSPEEIEQGTGTDAAFWADCSTEEITHLLAVFGEEVETVYPFIDSSELAFNSMRILQLIRDPKAIDDVAAGPDEIQAVLTDIDLTKVAVATGIAIEAHGKNDLCAAIVETVVARTSRISKSEVNLKGIQLLMMLSIYYFHSDDELLAWRTIGVAARGALEMGLHRQNSLNENFPDPQSLHRAKRIFWCCYVLDRRWSFGTSLSFALADRDIDATLFEADIDSPYLRCMVEYARLCSDLWNAIPALGAPSPSIPRDVALRLDASTQGWMDSIPSHLKMRHPAAPPDSPSQGRVLQRLRALLYLRGNLIRISLYQHHLLSAASINADIKGAQTAVEIAQDTIQVLVHLNATSDIYSRQQNAFNYFLLNAFAVVSLAICHAPDIFAAPCSRSFNDAIGLVRGFSRHSMASRRLWNSIRELLPRLKNIGLKQFQGEKVEAASQAHHGQANAMMPSNSASLHQYTSLDTKGDHAWPSPHQSVINSVDVGPSPVDIPDNSTMNSDILSVFDDMGRAMPFEVGGFDAGLYMPIPGCVDSADMSTDISRNLMQGLM